MSKFSDMYDALAPAKENGYTVTQEQYNQVKAELATANERIRELEDTADEYKQLHGFAVNGFNRVAGELTAEREVSDKLVAALKVAKAFCDGLTAEECPDTVALPISAALAEVAHIRSQEVAAT